jgi:D-serine deaminase-like pyridoxal phosphate-dependent protein
MSASSKSPSRLYIEYLSALREHRAPLAWLDVVAFENNINWISKQSASKKIRLGSKSLRARWAIESILKSNPIFQGVLTISIPEALWLFSKGINDFLVAYPTTQSLDFKDLATAVRAGAKITLMVDRTEHADLIQNYADSQKIDLQVAIDLDVSSDFGPLHFGVYRSSLKKIKDLRALLSHRNQWPRIRWTALMAYEAQIAGVPDYFSNPFKNILIRYLKNRSKSQVLERRQEAIEWLNTHGIELELVNGGGTGSLNWTANDPSTTEVTVGSGFFAPILFDSYENLSLQPALGFALRISRHPEKSIFTCTGGGYPASGSAGLDRLPKVYLPSDGELIGLEGVGEVQTPVRVLSSKVEVPFMGDLIFFRHPKAGELCERFSAVQIIRDGKWIQEIPTYRGEGQTWI